MINLTVSEAIKTESNLLKCRIKQDFLIIPDKTAPEVQCDIPVHSLWNIYQLINTLRTQKVLEKVCWICA